VIKRILDSDYEGFYLDEIENRKILKYPPFSRIINIIISSLDEKGLEKVAFKYYEDVKNDKLEIYGPMKAPIYRVKNRYRYQIFIKGGRREINRVKKTLLEKSREYKSDKIRITIDVDPINLM
jgi:primosomal protein N' (replication factor Y)